MSVGVIVLMVTTVLFSLIIASVVAILVATGGYKKFVQVLQNFQFKIFYVKCLNDICLYSALIYVIFICNFFFFTFHLIGTPSSKISKTGSHSKNLNMSPVFTQYKLVVVSSVV